jgi:NAD(P)-dependent dehydrogenase (short-subunit alcohol dehydrogenase family)
MDANENGTRSRGAIVISGASTGIGAACAHRLAREGFTVFAGVRKDEDADTLRKENADRLRPLRLDVTDEASIAAARHEVADAVGERGIAGLVNNAGIGLGGPIEFLPLTEWRAQFDVNLFGTVATTQAFLPLIRTGKGRVVIIGSIGGRFASPFIGPYCASKFALEAVADALAASPRHGDMRLVGEMAAKVGPVDQRRLGIGPALQFLVRPSRATS